MPTWHEALKQWNSNKGSWCIPRKGTAGHDEIKKIMGKPKPKSKSKTKPKSKSMSKPKSKSKTMSKSHKTFQRSINEYEKKRDTRTFKQVIDEIEKKKPILKSQSKPEIEGILQYKRSKKKTFDDASLYHDGANYYGKNHGFDVTSQKNCVEIAGKFGNMVRNNKDYPCVHDLSDESFRRIKKYMTYWGLAMNDDGTATEENKIPYEKAYLFAVFYSVNKLVIGDYDYPSNFGFDFEDDIKSWSSALSFINDNKLTKYLFAQKTWKFMDSKIDIRKELGLPIKMKDYGKSYKLFYKDGEYHLRYVSNLLLKRLLAERKRIQSVKEGMPKGRHMTEEYENIIKENKSIKTIKDLDDYHSKKIREDVKRFTIKSKPKSKSVSMPKPKKSLLKPKSKSMSKSKIKSISMSKPTMKKIDDIIKNSTFNKDESINYPKQIREIEEPQKVIEYKNNAIFNKEVIENIYKVYNGVKSKREIDKLKKLVKHDKFIQTLENAERAFDFFPTPLKCIDALDIDPLMFTSFLEPSCGFGSILYYILNKDYLERQKQYNNSVPIKSTAYEFYPGFKDFLTESFPKTNIHIGDFLKSPNTNDYDLIVCNPPFTNNNDTKYYINFLFKCFLLLNNSKSKTYMKQLYFLCPRLTKKEYTEKSEFDPNEIFDNIPKSKIKKLTTKGDEEYICDYLDEIIPHQIMFLQICSGFASTNIKVYMYLMNA